MNLLNFPVLIIPDPNFSIPDLNFVRLGSQIRIKAFRYFNPKTCFSALGSGLFIPDPDPGAKKAPDPGSATLRFSDQVPGYPGIPDSKK
jgi:hypothetical protein